MDALTGKKPNSSQQTIATTVELFCGIGGFRLAAEERNIRTVWANDICPKACKVYRDRFGDAEIRQGDIHELAHEIPAHDLLTAGFPYALFGNAVPPVIAGWVMDCILKNQVAVMTTPKFEQLSLFSTPYAF